MTLFVCLFVSSFVNTITPEPLEISSRTFQLLLASKGRTSSKMAIGGCANGEKTSLMFSSYWRIQVGENLNTYTGWAKKSEPQMLYT